VRITYVARHQQRASNDDEGAIAYALERLGHQVRRVQERDVSAADAPCDLILCHHFPDPAALRCPKAPKAWWCFDLLGTANDPSLVERARRRAAWARQMTEVCDIGFLTDGDFVAADTTGKLHWLPQGADERYAGAPALRPTQTVPILFTGIGKGGGRQRESFVAEMQGRYGERFRHVTRGVHGYALADLVASASIAVAPDSPVTDRYASNRIFVTLGLGGFLLHPACEALLGCYGHGQGVVYYRDREELHSQIGHYLGPLGGCRQSIAAAGLARTLEANLYRHRCEKLLAVVKEKLGV
jgi:hypothetical protein